MRENCTSGTVPGAPGNRRPYGGEREAVSALDSVTMCNRKVVYGQGNRIKNCVNERSLRNNVTDWR